MLSPVSTHPLPAPRRRRSTPLRPGGSPLLACAALLPATLATAQANPAATTRGDLQVGAGYTRANPDYSPNAFNGFGVFADFDINRFIGVTGEFHRIAGPSRDNISESTFGGGLKLRYPLGRFEPNLRILGGAGTFSFQHSAQNGTYSMFAGGGGLDYRLTRRYILRADYEYQRWGSFPPTGLQPNLFTLGAAYRFH